jgi:hypothetical protein
MTPNLVPKSTQNLYKGDQQNRQRQISSYSADKHHNQSQMDQIRHDQYRKQNTAVNKQKTDMQQASKDSSRALHKTFESFTEFMIKEGGRPANPEDAEFLKKNPEPNFTGEKRERKKGGPLALRRPTGLQAPEKKEDDVIDVEVKDVQKKPKEQKKSKGKKQGSSVLDAAQAQGIKDKSMLDREKFEYSKTQAEVRKKERDAELKDKEKKEKAARWKNRLGKVGNLAKGVAGSVLANRDSHGAPGAPGSPSVEQNRARMVSD